MDREECGIDNCRSTLYHQDNDGYTYCSNGHQVEARVQTLHESLREGDLAGSRTTRKKEEIEEREAILLSGREALKLYLQCFQLVLWKQTNWLVHTKGYPKELEVIVHDLWSLRTHLIKDMIVDREEGRSSRLFSSQTDTENSGDDESQQISVSHARFHSKAPKLVESVVLCYLALLLLRIPVCAGDVCEWILSHDFVYLRAIQAIPLAMRQRLPISLRSALLAKSGMGEMERFHATTMGLCGTFQKTFAMVIPPLNTNLLLFNFICELSLPLECHFPTLKLASLLNITFSFPYPPRKYQNISTHPEVSLIAVLLTTVKLFHPFDGIPRLPTSITSPGTLAMNWKQWNDSWPSASTHERAVADRDMTGEFDLEQDTSHANNLNTSESDVLGMSAGEIDDYLSWFERTWTGDAEQKVGHDRGGDKEFRRVLFKMFPTGSSPESGSKHEEALRKGGPANEELPGKVGTLTPDRQQRDESEEVLDSATRMREERLKAMQSSLIVRLPVDDNDEISAQQQGVVGQGTLRPGSVYKHYRTEEELPSIARPFFEKAAKLTGLSVAILVLAVFQVEMKVQNWVREERSRAMVDNTGSTNGG